MERLGSSTFYLRRRHKKKKKKKKMVIGATKTCVGEIVVCIAVEAV